MAKLWRLMGEYDAETTAYSGCAGASQTSPYTPDFTGTLIGVRTQVSAEAATSLVQHVQIRMTCTKFNPNAIEFYAQGNGLQTVPANRQEEQTFTCEQPVQAGVPITVEARCNTGTDVTNHTYIYGLFQV